MKFALNERSAVSAAAFLLLTAGPVLADIAPAEWVALYESVPTGNPTPFDYVAALTSDGEGNVYSAITGEDLEGDDYIVLIKYDASGVVQWTSNFKGRSHTRAAEIALDQEGNVFVAGTGDYPFGMPAPPTGVDIVTLKFDPNGTLLWASAYAEFSSDAPEDIAVNAAGQVYVTGYSYNWTNTMDYVTIKYDVDGTELWVRRFDGAAGNEDRPSDLALDRWGNVLVTGATTVSCYFDDDGDEECYTNITTLKYSPTGDLIWERSFDGPDGGTDRGSALAVDRFGNVHVTGISRDTNFVSRWVTIKYSPDGRRRWTRFARVEENRDGPSAIVVNRRGQVYVSGGAKFSVLKYSPRGRTIWSRSLFPGRVRGMALDKQGNLCLGGRTIAEPASAYTGAKLDPAGNLLWCGAWDRNTSGRQIVLDFAVTPEGTIYVGGYSFGTLHGDPAAATVKFAPPVTVALPTVNVYALDPIAHEGGFGRRPSGTLMIWRRGSTENDLTVHYQVDGSATNGGDYQALSGEVTFPAGSTRVFLEVQPIDDPIFEFTERVNLRLLADDQSDYRTGPRDRATVYILDDDRGRLPWFWPWWQKRFR